MTWSDDGRNWPEHEGELMCTSFAIYKDEPIYAMNFDCWDVSAKIAVRQLGAGRTAFYFYCWFDNKYLETAAMNSDGFFGNFQENRSSCHKNIDAGSDSIRIEDLYLNCIKRCKSMDDWWKMLGDRTVRYHDVPPEIFRLHNLFADTRGNALVLETCEKKNAISGIRTQYLAMTNFPMWGQSYWEPEAVAGLGADRYMKASIGIERLSQQPQPEDVFGILQDVAQFDAGCKTLVSMVFFPTRAQVHVCLRRDFDNVFMVRICDGQIEPQKGFDELRGTSVLGDGMVLDRYELFGAKG